MTTQTAHNITKLIFSLKRAGRTIAYNVDEFIKTAGWRGVIHLADCQQAGHTIDVALCGARQSVHSIQIKLVNL